MSKLPKLGERGIVHLLIPIILILGLIAGVYLVTSGNPLKLFSRASVSKPTTPETSFTLEGPSYCSDFLCSIIGKSQPDEIFGVKLYARSDIEGANLFTARMTFPKDLVEVTEIQKEGSFVTNWVEEYYDNKTGEIALSGGVPDPGYKTEMGKESGLVAIIFFHARKLGTGTVAFTDGSAIYSNLNNINILTITRPYDISVEVKPTPEPTVNPTPAPTATPAGRFLKVTYPNGGEDLKIGDTVRLKWDSGKIDKVMIGYSFGPGSLDWITSSGTIANTNYYDWKVNINKISGTKVKIEVVGYETGVGSLTDQSDDFFTVSQPSTKGDGNKDGRINLTDMSVQHTDWKPSDSYKKTIRQGIDMNDDGFVNSIDFSALRGLLQQLGVIKVKK